jgi:hypothetical protein
MGKERVARLRLNNPMRLSGPLQDGVQVAWVEPRLASPEGRIACSVGKPDHPSRFSAPVPFCHARAVETRGADSSACDSWPRHHQAFTGDRGPLTAVIDLCGSGLQRTRSGGWSDRTPGRAHASQYSPRIAKEGARWPIRTLSHLCYRDKLGIQPRRTVLVYYKGDRDIMRLLISGLGIRLTLETTHLLSLVLNSTPRDAPFISRCGKTSVRGDTARPPEAKR